MSATLSRVIEVTVSPTGETTVQTKGFVGPSCQDASRFLERTLGERITETLTPEYHQPQSTHDQIQQR